MAPPFTEEHKNWIKVAHGLLVVKDGVAAFIDREFKTFHQRLQREHGTCTSCKTIAQINGPNDICNEWVNAIRAEKAVGGSLCWKNCDLEYLSTTYWELAKVFMGQGQKPSNTGPDQTDTSNLLTTLINCKLFDEKVDVAVARTVIYRRNDLFHAGQQEMDETTMKACFDDMDMLLGDSKLSPHCPEAKAARPRLKEISSTDFVVTLEHEQKAYTELLSTMTSFVSQIHDDMSHVRQDVPQMRTDLASLKKQLTAVMTAVEKQLSTKEDVEAVGNKLGSLIKVVDESVKVVGMNMETEYENQQKLVEDLEKTLKGPDIVADLRKALKSHYETKLKEYDIGIKSDPFPAHVHLQADYVTHQLQRCQHESSDTGSALPSKATPAARRILVENKQADSEKYTLALKLISDWVNAMERCSTSETYRIPILIDGKKKMTGDIYDSMVKQLLGKSWLGRRQKLEEWMLGNHEKVLVIFDGYHECCSICPDGISYTVDDSAVPKFLSEIICDDLLTEVHLLVTSKTGFVQNTKYFTDVYGLPGLGHTTTSNHKELFSFVREHTTRRFDSQKRDSQQLDVIFPKLGKYALATIRKEGEGEKRVMSYPDEEINKLSFDFLPDEDVAIELIELIGIVQKIDRSSQNVQFTHAAFAEFLAAKYLSDTDSDERRETLKDILLEPHLHQVLRSACNLASAEPDGALKDMFEVWCELMPSPTLMQYIYQADNSNAFLSLSPHQVPWHHLSHLPFAWLTEIENTRCQKILVKNILEHLNAIYISSLCTNCIEGIQTFTDVANEMPASEIDVYIDVSFGEVPQSAFHEELHHLYQAFKTKGSRVIHDFYTRHTTEERNWIEEDSAKVEDFGIDFIQEYSDIEGAEAKGLPVYKTQRDVLNLKDLKSPVNLKRLHLRRDISEPDKELLENILPECSILQDFALLTTMPIELETVIEKLPQKCLLKLHLSGVSLGEKDLVSIFQNSGLQKLRIHDLYIDAYDENTRRKVLAKWLPRMTSLQELGLTVRYQSILGEVVPLIPSFEKLQSLYLELGEDVCLSGLASGLGDSKSLRKLVLRGKYQSITEKEAKELADCLGSLSSLCAFSIQRFDLSEAEVLSIISIGLTRCKSLALVSFNCSMHDSHLDAIADMLTSNSTIESLTMDNTVAPFSREATKKFVKRLKSVSKVGRPRMFNLFFTDNYSQEDRMYLSNCNIY